MSRVYGYCRVSSDQQEDGESLDIQGELIQKFSKERGLPKPTIIKEVETATKNYRDDKRVKLHALISELTAGDLLLVRFLDRFARDTLTGLMSIDQIHQRGAKVVFINEGIDTRDPGGELQITMLLGFAKQEARRIKERTVGARKHLKSIGLYSEGLPPLGYVREESTGRRKSNLLVPDPETVPIVRESFELAASGMNVPALIAHLRAKYPAVPLKTRRGGVHQWTRTPVFKMLRNRTYLGEVKRSEFNKESDSWVASGWEKGRHEAIISLDLFNRVQRNIDSRFFKKVHANARTSSSMIKGHPDCRCALCDEGIRFYRKSTRATQSPDVNVLAYYLCAGKRRAPGSCKSGYMSAPKIEEALRAQLEERVQKLIPLLRTWKPEARTMDRTQELEARASELAEEKGRNLKLFRKGLISEPELDREVARIQGDLDRVNRALAKMDLPTLKNRKEETIAKLKKVNLKKASMELLQKLLILLAKTIKMDRETGPMVTWIAPEELLRA